MPDVWMSNLLVKRCSDWWPSMLPQIEAASCQGQIHQIQHMQFFLWVHMQLASTHRQRTCLQLAARHQAGLDGSLKGEKLWKVMP